MLVYEGGGTDPLEPVNVGLPVGCDERIDPGEPLLG